MQPHQAELKSYRATYKIELQGAIDAFQELIAGALPYMFQGSGGTGPIIEAQKLESGPMLSRLMYHALVKDSDALHLPTIEIQAGIHAAIRWNKERRYTPNDWLDISHAVAGVPYCDVLFTERSLASLLRSSNLRYDKRYETVIAHTVEDAINAIA